LQETSCQFWDDVSSHDGLNELKNWPSKSTMDIGKSISQRDTFDGVLTFASQYTWNHIHCTGAPFEPVSLWPVVVEVQVQTRWEMDAAFSPHSVIIMSDYYNTESIEHNES